MNAIFHIFLSKSKNTFTKPDESIYDGAAIFNSKMRKKVTCGIISKFFQSHDIVKLNHAKTSTYFSHIRFALC
jgi:hypothetical protein